MESHYAGIRKVPSVYDFITALQAQKMHLSAGCIFLFCFRYRFQHIYFSIPGFAVKEQKCANLVPIICCYTPTIHIHENTTSFSLSQYLPRFPIFLFVLYGNTDSIHGFHIAYNKWINLKIPWQQFF